MHKIGMILPKQCIKMFYIEVKFTYIIDMACWYHR